MGSKALTKIQSIILIVVIVVTTIGGSVAYVLLNGEHKFSETIKIGVLADLDGTVGKNVWQGVMLAVEQVNAEGGVLGRNFEVVSQDDDAESGGIDPNVISNALTKLIAVDKADFLICIGGIQRSQIIQEKSAELKKIHFITMDSDDILTQKVLENYDKYKYFFRSGLGNITSAIAGVSESILVCREITGFNKVAFIYPATYAPLISLFIDVVSDYGFDIVLSEGIAVQDQSLDFSSAFAKAETAGAEILYPFIGGPPCIPFVKEYYDRQSPLIIWGNVALAERGDFWQSTDGKCEYITSNGLPVVAGYPLTSKTVLTKEAYVERWGEEIGSTAAAAYDTVRFILPDAIRRAGTIETESVIEALEETDIETSLARRFVFTSSHDIMVGKEGPNRLSEDYYFVAMFQWQDGVQVPVYPIELMEEAGATYTFPDWPGPWDNLD